MAQGRTRAGPRLRPLAPLTTRFFNPVMRRLAPCVPGLGVLTHVGRRTGRVRSTPLLIFRRGDRYEIGLWYGADVHWVKNIVAAGSCVMRIRGRDVRLERPELHDDVSVLPVLVRIAGRLMRLRQVLRLRIG